MIWDRKQIEGGEIVAIGNYVEIVKNKLSLTGKYLSGELSIPIPEKEMKEKINQLKLLAQKKIISKI